MRLTAKFPALLHGYVRIRICGGDSRRFLNLCANRRIRLWRLDSISGGYEANLFRQDFLRLRPLARKCRTRVRLLEKRGLPFFLNRNRKRKAFAAGLFCCVCLIFLLSRVIWNISVSGNQSVSRETVLAFLKEQQTGYGTPKSRIDCSQLAAALRSRFETFTWVSVRISGTQLSVSVQENTAETVEETKTKDAENVPMDLVADCDGIVASIVTRAGTPLVKEGDTVAAGQVLVSGLLEITDDSGETVSWQTCCADADVYLQTKLSYSEEIPLAHETKDRTGKRRFGVYLKFFGKYVGFFPGYGSLKQSDILCQERQLRLFADFYLPVSAGFIQAEEYRDTVHLYTAKEAETLAKAHLQKFLEENEEKGVQIFQNNVRIETDTSVCKAEGTITVIQKADRKKQSVQTEAQDKEAAE